MKMDSPRIGSASRDFVLVSVDTADFTLMLRGKPYHPTVEGIGVHHGVSNSLTSNTVNVQLAAYRGPEVSIWIYNPQMRDLVEFEHCPYPLFYENQDYYLSIRSKDGAAVSFHHESKVIRDAVHLDYPDLLMGHLNFRNEVGLTELLVRVDGREALRLCIEVFPAKLDYRTDYQRILHDVEEQVYNLAYSFLTRTFHNVSPVHTTQSSLTEFFSLFRVVFNNLLSSLRRINMFPHHGLVPEQRMIMGSRAKRWDRFSTQYVTRHPNVLVVDNDGYLQIDNQWFAATKLPQTRKIVNTNTHENRLVRWMLERILVKLEAVRESYVQMERKTDVEVLNFLDGATKQLRWPLTHGVLRDVNSIHNMTATLALQLSPGYREVYRAYLLVMKGLQVSSDLFRMSLKDLSTLYEYWCFLQLHTILKRHFDLVNEDVVKVHRDGLFVSLNKAKDAAFHYKNSKTGERISLVYNALPSYVKGPLPTVPQRPDTVLTILREGRDHRFSYIFDAKYRINPALPGTDYARYGGPGPEEDDINTMHRYRDAIVYQDAQGNYQKSMFGAYLLFPYADEGRYQDHQFYKSIDKVNIGGLPFLPGSTRLVEKLLERILETPR